MSETPGNLQASTTDAGKAIAQSSQPLPDEGAAGGQLPPIDDGGSHIMDFEIGPGVERAVDGRPYERKAGTPLYRPLRIFALDPSASRLEGATALVNVPYEPLKPGPIGKIFRVEGDPIKRDEDAKGKPSRGNRPRTNGSSYSPVNLDAAAILILDGRAPSPSDKNFHEQMVYAVCSLVYAAFRTALGRHIAWGFDPQPDQRKQLLIRPRAFEGANAFYNKESGELCFGYYTPKEVTGRNLPGGRVYTCLSHDIVVHEVTHALLDGLRTHFTFPSTPDVPAFHEAFADLVAIFQHFSYEQVVRTAIRKARGDISRAELLTNIALQFGQTTRGVEQALRSAIDADDQAPTPYNPSIEAHKLGSVLVGAVFEAFITVYRRKTERYMRLATNGTGDLPPGEIPQDLQVVLAAKASKLASQFLTMCIRAVDYCPPVDLQLGEYLRAVITADSELVPDDPWGYREAWIDAFRRRYIYPDADETESLSEDSLLWRCPEIHIPSIPGLTFAELKFDGDPAWPANKKELVRQASALGESITRCEYAEAFGLACEGDERLKSKDLEIERNEVEKPCVHSIRSSRRVGPDGQVVFDLVAEVTQRRRVLLKGMEQPFDFYGGATIIIDPRGALRYVISKKVTNDKRLKKQIAFMRQRGNRAWDFKKGVFKLNQHLFKLLHTEHAD